MLKSLEATISPARLATYVVEAGHDEARALALYIWNVRLGESFHLPIQAVEIALRNRINSGLERQFGADWWQDAGFAAVADERRLGDILEVQSRITRRGHAVATGQIVAGLSFGFWVAMLDARYNPSIWSASLSVAFPHLPQRTGRAELQQKVRGVANFRNRIWHHEPIFRDNVTVEYSRCIEVLRWLCPAKCRWVKPQCRVMAVLREKP